MEKLFGQNFGNVRGWPVTTALFERLVASGYPPFRLGVQARIAGEPASEQLVEVIRRAIDPHGITS